MGGRVKESVVWYVTNHYAQAAPDSDGTYAPAEKKKCTNVVPLTIPERAKLIKDTIEKCEKGQILLDTVNLMLQIIMISYCIHWVLCLLALFQFSQYKESIF